MCSMYVVRGICVSVCVDMVCMCVYVCVVWYVCVCVVCVCVCTRLCPLTVKLCPGDNHVS